MTDSNRVEFWILVEGEIYLSPSISKQSSVAALLRDWQGKPECLTNAVIPQCTIYKFRTPIQVSSKDEDDEGTPAACLEAGDNWMKLPRTARVKRLGGDEYLTSEYVCLVVETPKAKRETALYNLQGKHRVIFQSLQIFVEDFGSWSKEDVIHNLQGGSFWSNDDEPTGPAASLILELENHLAENRLYEPDAGNTQYAKYRSLALGYELPFDKYFVKPQGPITRQSPHVKDSREFVAVYSALRCHNPDAKRVAEEKSSHFKANQLSTYFFTPPFFSCQQGNSKTVFKTEMPWGFPLFIATREERSNMCKYIPNSDFGVFVKDFLCPLLVSEVISDEDETDRNRMLLQAIAAVRAANVLKKRDSQKCLFVVAVYLRANLTAERYIVVQTGKKNEVTIAQRDYNLKESAQALDFLKNMFNLQARMEDLAGELDDSKRGALSRVAETAKPITSLTQKKKETKPTQASGTIDSIPEEPQQRGQGQADDHLFTDHPEIQKYLAETGFEVKAPLFGFPNVAFISRKDNPSVRGFLKLTKREREVEVSRLLAETRPPENHTIAGLEVLPLSSGGYVIYTHSGGSHLVDLETPDLHMWSAAKQLVEGIAFMHAKNVAHLDIKPANVLMPPKGGRLSIIDFSISVVVTSCEKIHGRKGTEGYMAPEVRKEDTLYDPIRADLWSCGKTLEMFLSKCKQSTRQKYFLDGIIEQLMDDEPSKRPKMSDVLKSMKAFENPTVAHHPQSLL